ncbi:hypothetical protein [Nannocystis sp. SCPEA4]|uniref:hypothetical protein n=1 Tax=Nannocystis sp. SCPEA4 TaxID=2996787 RepID=UPI002270F07B|nr:hypothetical protein [Nannocystis sp. SCPEA4]MCY1059320.1 hypothetical protein [Nannocystis sp. SCPEA4]
MKTAPASIVARWFSLCVKCACHPPMAHSGVVARAQMIQEVVDGLELDGLDVVVFLVDGDGVDDEVLAELRPDPAVGELLRRGEGEQDGVGQDDHGAEGQIVAQVGRLDHALIADRILDVFGDRVDDPPPLRCRHRQHPFDSGEERALVQIGPFIELRVDVDHDVGPGGRNARAADDDSVAGVRRGQQPAPGDLVPQLIDPFHGRHSSSFDVLCAISSRRV